MKRSRARRARAFALSFGVSLVILSLIFIPIMLKISPLKESYFTTSSKPQSEAPLSYIPSTNDVMTALVIVTEDGVGRYFILVRFDPINRRIPVSSLPYTMRVITSERTDTLAGFDIYGGTLMVKEILESVFKITIDRTARLSSDSFVKALNTLGTVKYTLPYSLVHKDTSSDTYINVPKGTQMLDGRSIYDMFRFPQYAEGEEHRYKVQSDLIAKLLNQRVDSWLVKHGDSVFQTLVGLGETDISYNDYQQRRSALRSFAEMEEDFAIPIFVSGQFTSQGFSITQQSVDTIHMYFAPEDETVSEEAGSE